MDEFILKGVELGVHGVDITTYWLKSAEPEYLLHLRHLGYKNGMLFSGAGIATNMCQPDAIKRAEELAKIKLWVDRTEMLGASHLRVFGGVHKARPDRCNAWLSQWYRPSLCSG